MAAPRLTLPYLVVLPAAQLVWFLARLSPGAVTGRRTIALPGRRDSGARLRVPRRAALLRAAGASAANRDRQRVEPRGHLLARAVSGDPGAPLARLEAAARAPGAQRIDEEVVGVGPCKALVWSFSFRRALVPGEDGVRRHARGEDRLPARARRPAAPPGLPYARLQPARALFKLLAHARRIRLSAEVARDAALEKARPPIPPDSGARAVGPHRRRRAGRHRRRRRLPGPQRP